MSRLYLRKTIATIQPATGTGKTIEDLRMTFTVQKTNEKNPNRSKLEIYNLSPTSKGLLETKNAKISLAVGYEDTVSIVAVGDITKVVHERSGPDIISKIEFGDGDNKYRNSRIEKGYPPGVTTSKVIDDLILESGLIKGVVIGVPQFTYANGLSLSGLVRDELERICVKNNLEFSIQNEVIQIIPKDSFTTDSIVFLDKTSGLIGEPNKTAKGVEFISLIQPRLKPGSRVQIKSDKLSGIFKLQKVIHEGDNQGGDFLSSCEATI